MDADPEAWRSMCWSCRRPRSVCWCADLRPIPSRTKVLFLQHPMEARVGVSTCRMAHRSLPNSELYVGLTCEEHPALAAQCALPATAVLYPSPGATDVRDVKEPLARLVIVDGTWSTAKKLVERSPTLSTLPRLSLSPPRPGNYRIRKEPFSHGLATIEAVSYALDLLEGPSGTFEPMLRAFDAMVERQLAFIAVSGGRSRHRRQE